MDRLASARARLEQLLQQRADSPARATEIEAQIHREFERSCAILVLDLSGFTRLSIHHGIVNFLTLVQRMRTLATPEVIARGGVVFKTEADNLFARFETVDPALDAAQAMLAALERSNAGRGEESCLRAGIGIGCGRVLVVGDEDIHGTEMNLACKLGEDLARSGEILLTAAARAQATRGRFKPVLFNIGGLELPAHALDTGA